MYDPDSETEYDCNQMLDVQEVYRELMTACLESEADPIDVLVALTLVLRDLALSYHGPDAARSRSVDALDHSFALEAPVWPSETIH
ncbi:MAG: hypothetical protein OEM59_20410 [Rhodospirillales bacterium]|jgi:hypothetical protein|nr:hypothetical protein [Rhodospirillales bacterium]